VKQQFERTTELLDYCNDEIDEVKIFRTRWAISHFLKNVLPYIIWLVMLLIVAFGQGTRGNSKYFLCNMQFQEMEIRIGSIRA
jgi:hypothetical protein